MKRHRKSFYQNVKKISSSIIHSDKVSVLKPLLEWFNSRENYEVYDCGIVKPYYDGIKAKLYENNFCIDEIKVYKVEHFFVCTYIVKAKDVYKKYSYSKQSSSGNELLLYTAAIVFNISCKQHNHCGILHQR